MSFLSRNLPLLLVLSSLARLAAGAEPSATFAVRTPAGDDGRLAAAVRSGPFFRWALPRLPGVRAEVGATASGRTTITALRLPPEEGQALAPLIAGLPLDAAALSRGEVVFDGTRYPGPTTAVALRLPPGRPSGWLVAGRDEGVVAGLVNRVLLGESGAGRGHWGVVADYLVSDGRARERSGHFRVGEEGRRTVDRGSEHDDFRDQARWAAGLVPIPGSRVTLFVPSGRQGRPELLRLARELDRAVAELEPRVPIRLRAPLAVAVEEDYVAQGRHTGQIGPAVPGVPGGPDLHLVYDPRDLGAYRYALARLLVARSPQVPARTPRWLARGAALWLSRDWYGRPYDGWLPLLAAAGVLPEARELLAEGDQEDASEALWTPVAAALVAGLDGKTAAAKLSRVPDEAAVVAGLRRVAALSQEAGADASPRELPRFLAGVSLGMTNRLEEGYHSPTAEATLDRLAGLGADSVSLMPFAYQPDPARPELRYLNRSPSSETDVGLLHAARAAHARGLVVLWKPQIWVRRGWSGDIAMRTDSDWDAWFRAYRRFVVHHALLARFASAELFSVGVELGGTVEQERRWRRLIAAVRLFFPGRLTYSANWYGDVDRVGFWDALDLVGVDAYYPLASSADAGAGELARGAREVRRRLAAIAERSGRRVLLTEVGFAARRGAWVDPHREGGEVSEGDQERAYRALFSALGQPPWLAGVYLWKVMTGGDRGEGPSFLFLGRPAEAAVRSYFARRAPPRTAAGASEKR